MSNNNPLGYDTLKLRAVFIPDGNPNNVSTADITNHLGHDSLRIRAVFIPDGNPNTVSPADITNWLGHDVVKVRYVWNGSGESQPGQEQEPPADGPDGGERAAGPIQGADGAGFTPIGQPAGPAMSPTPTLVQAARYVDPAKTAAAAWRAIAALSPPNQPAVPRGADGQGGTGARPDAGSADTSGSSGLEAHVANDSLNLTDPSRLFANIGSGVTAGLQGKGDSGSITQVQAVIVAPPPPPVAGGPVDDPALAASNYIARGLQAVTNAIGSIVNSQAGDTQAKPPAGPKPIDKTPWSGDHAVIKEATGAAPNDNTSISPDDDVWSQNPDGSWTNYGPANDYTGSGQPSGQRGKDR